MQPAYDFQVAADLSPTNNEDENVAANHLEPILSIVFAAAAQNVQTSIRYSAAKES